MGNYVAKPFERMNHMRKLKRAGKVMLSVLLTLSLLLSLAVPLNLTASAAEEEAATGSQIYAFLNYIDPSKNSNYNLELVFKNENVKDSNYYKGPYTDFADVEYVTTTYTFDSTGRPSKTWNYNQWSPGNTPEANRLPWGTTEASHKGDDIRKVTFKNKIAPKSIAGWFCYLRYLCKIENFENLDVSRCENMAFAFWQANTGFRGDKIMDGTETLSNQYLKSLDFSQWDTSKCRNFDCFLNSVMLESLDLSNFSFAGLNDNIVNVKPYGTTTYDANGKRTAGYPAYTGAMRTVTCFVYNCSGVQTVKLDNFDFADIEFLSSFLVNTAVTKLDLSKIKNDPIHVTSAESMFSTNSKLTEVIFGEEGNPFEIGTEPMYLGYPRNGGIDPFRPDDKNGSGNYYENGYKSNAIWLGNFLAGCSALETVNLQYLKINGFGKKADGTSYPANSPDYGQAGFNRTNPNLGNGVRPQLNNFFADCTSLERIENLNNLGFKTATNGNWPTRMMFQNCKSLTEIDFSDYWANLGGPLQFQNCTSLKKLNLANMGRSIITDNYWYTTTYDAMSKGFQSYYEANGTKTKPNVFDGCTELSEVTLSPYYYGAVPHANRTVSDNARPAVSADKVLTYAPSGYSSIEKDIPPVDPEALWIKIKDPEDGAFNLDLLNNTTDGKNYYYKNGRTDKDRNTEIEQNLYPVNGTPLTTLELFGDYKPHYAGTWVRASKIALNAKGATPARQTFDGAVGLAVNYNPEEIQDPIRPGYEFLGWYATDENGVEKKLDEQLAANKDDNPDNDEVITAWAYYAKWKENKYNLILNGNGGTTTVNNETVSSFTAKENLPYSEYFELNNSMFTRDGYVLSGWNTRPNGSGDEYAANESVAKLSTVDGATVTLYAQWHKPDLILHFDANYDGAPAMPDRNYTLKTGEKTYYGDLAEATRNGYTFDGWYTEATGGTKVTDTTEVDARYTTLYAHWIADPVVTFEANGGYFETKASTNSTTVIRQYKYGQYYGVLPTAVNDNAVLKGWYTKDGTGGDWGNEITSAADNGGTAITSASDKIAKENKTYYARWGYQPEFESNGGVYKTFDNYPIQDGNQYVVASPKYAAEHPEYIIPTLPTFKDETGFQGWFFNGTNITEYLKTHDSYTIDMSRGKTVEAHWATKDVYEVTLHTDGGSLPNTYLDTAADSYRIRVYAGNSIEELPTLTKSVGSTVYEFLGWYTAADGGEKKDYTFIPPGDCDLYAHWAAKDVTVTFDAGDGTLFLPGDATVNLSSGSTVKKLPGANRSGGYTLGGWFTGDGANGEWGDELTLDTPITTNATYHAKWIPADDLYITAEDSLYKYTVKWETRSIEYATNIGDNLIIAPTNGNSALAATLYINFNFDTVAAGSNKSLPVGSVKIKVPKYVFADKDGNKVGTNNIANGLSKTDTADCHFIYDDSDPDCYIITNNEVINEKSPHNNQVFQIDYRLEPSDLRKMNGGYLDEKGYYGGNYYTNTFPVTIQVDRDLDGVLETEDGGLDANYQKNLSLEVHTKVNAATSKTRSTVSFEWKDAWGEEPQDSNQYFYVIWDLNATFDTANSQMFKFSWSEDAVHDGTVVKITYDSKYKPADYMSPGTYHTTVITKHPRKTTDSGWKTVYNEAVLNVESISGYKQQFRVSREDGVYLIPSGPGRDFEKQIFGYSRGADRIKSGGTELILNRSGVGDMKFEIEYHEYKNDDSEKEWYPVSKTYYVPERNIEISDGVRNHGDVVMSAVTGNDRYNWNYAGNVALSDSDYSFTDLDIYLTEYDAIRVNGDWSEPFVHSAFRDYGDVEIWIRGENEDFRLFKTLKASDFTENDVEAEDTADYGVAVSSVTLPERTAGYKVVHKSSFYTTMMMVCPTLFLRSTNKVYSFVQDNMLNNINTLIKNNAVLSVDGETPVDSKRLDRGGAQICSYELKTDESYLYVTKKCAEDKKDSSGNDYYEVNSESGTQEFPVLISGWGINRAGSFKLMQSGVFYDLLPYNFTVDKSTIFVQARKENNGSTNSMSPHSYKNESANNNNLPSSLYSVEFIENWENSGRTMMKVTIAGVPDNLPPSYTNKINGFNVFYKMKTTVSNVIANGTTQMNYVSFTDTTENQTVPVSRDRALSAMDPKVIPYYKSIDDAYKEFTAYASDATHCKLPSQYVQGFSSSVKAEGVFMIEDKTVGLSSDYSYNVTFTTDGTSEASNVVIYDIIENNYNGSECEWRGMFRSIDVSPIQNLQDADGTYCAPKVYYLVKDGEVTPDDLDLVTNPGGIWSDTAPSDKSTIKAVAIDCRTGDDGEPFTVPARKALSFNVAMRSPDTSETNDLITFNEAIVKAQVGQNPNSSRAITRLMLHYANPELGKESFPESGKGPDPDDPEKVDRMGAVNGSTIDYSLTVTNPDSYVPIRNIVVEDLLDLKLKVNSIPKVKKGDDDPVSINIAAGISYSIEPQTGGRDKFTATITQLDPGETMTIIVPATVTDAENGYQIDNTATITSANGSTVNIPSETTYHYVTNTQAKIKKVDAKGDGLAGAKLQILSSDKEQVLVDNITSTTEVMSYDLDPGDYVLHEVSTPNNSYYKVAADIPFSIDIEGINKVNNKPVSYVEMVDENAYNIVFHENQPGHDDAVFKTFGPGDLDSNQRLAHFYAIPEWAGDEYVFAGWYHASDYSANAAASTIAANFGSDVYTKTEPSKDYHLYAKWIKVGTVEKATGENGDKNEYGNSPIRGFGLAGVQIRNPGMLDDNYSQNDQDTKPGGLRFVTSLSESLLTNIKGLYGQDAEYGYVVATEENINQTITHYNVKDSSKYKLQYKGENVNGVNTQPAAGERNADNNFLYVTNVNCTKGTGQIKNDHRNFSDYRLYTLVVTYEGDSADKKSDKLCARAYIRYTDANGMVRVFYNDYKKNVYYGGCLCSFNQVSAMALPSEKQ